MKVISEVEASILSRCIGTELTGPLEEFEWDTADELVERGLITESEIVLPCEDEDNEYFSTVYTTNTIGTLALTCYNAMKNGVISL